MSALRWAISALFFVLAAPVCALFAALAGTRRSDFVVRAMSATLVRLAGARIETRLHPDYEPGRPCFFVSNHVNLFDPFLLHAALPPLVRGQELESHFKLPVYGWLMKRAGNVPVPAERTPSALRRTYALTRAALEEGVSLVVFPEGSRTRDGRLGIFQAGVFRMARQLDYPLVPVSIEGAYRWLRTGTKRLRAGPVIVHVHAPVRATGLSRAELAELQERVRAVIQAPLGGSQ